MNPRYSRRTVLCTVPVLALGGCTAETDEETPAESASARDEATSTASRGAEGGDTPTESTPTNGPTATETPPASPTEETMTDDTDCTSTDGRTAQVEQLPEPSPLVESLTELVAAEDRESVAAEHGLDYRADERTVRVEIELAADGELPDGYCIESASAYGNVVDAHVHVDDLVPLAMESDVRIVREPPEAQTHGPDTN